MMTPEVEWTTAMLDEVFEKAQELYPDALSLAMDTADNSDDYEALMSVLNAANKILTSEALSHLVELGILDIDGIDETGDYLFKLSENVDSNSLSRHREDSDERS